MKNTYSKEVGDKLQDTFHQITIEELLDYIRTRIIVNGDKDLGTLEASYISAKDNYLDLLNTDIEISYSGDEDGTVFVLGISTELKIVSKYNRWVFPDIEADRLNAKLQALAEN